MTKGLPEVTDVFQQLKQDILWLHLKWNTFRDLYTDETRVALLNEQAPCSFACCKICWRTTSSYRWRS